MLQMPSSSNKDRRSQKLHSRAASIAECLEMEGAVNIKVLTAHFFQFDWSRGFLSLLIWIKWQLGFKMVEGLLKEQKGGSLASSVNRHADRAKGWLNNRERSDRRLRQAACSILRSFCFFPVLAESKSGPQPTFFIIRQASLLSRSLSWKQA